MSAALLLGQPLAGVVVAVMYAGGNLLEDFAVARAERDLKSLFPEATWNKLHLQMIFYGREHCTARGCDGTVWLWYRREIVGEQAVLHVVVGRYREAIDQCGEAVHAGGRPCRLSSPNEPMRLLRRG